MNWYCFQKSCLYVVFSLGFFLPVSLFGICQGSCISGWIGGLCQAKEEMGREMGRETEREKGFLTLFSWSLFGFMHLVFGEMFRSWVWDKQTQKGEKVQCSCAPELQHLISTVVCKTEWPACPCQAHPGSLVMVYVQKKEVKHTERKEQLWTFLHWWRTEQTW